MKWLFTAGKGAGIDQPSALMEVVEEVKKASSKWIKPKAAALRNFH